MLWGANRKSETHIGLNRPTENPYKSQNPSSWTFTETGLT